MKDYDNARLHIDQAQERDNDNRYVVDLQIQIATKQKDEATARSRLEILKVSDNESFYYHRKSTVDHAFGSKADAYSSAKLAVDSMERPTFPMLTQLIKCEILTDRLEDAAEHLDVIDKRFSKTRHDIRTGLHARWEIKKRNYDDALTFWEKLNRKDLNVHKAIRCDALQGLLSTTSVDDPRYASIEREFRELKDELGDFDDYLLELDLGADDPRE